MTAPFDRTAAIARVGFLMPALTDAGLRTVVEAAEVEARHHARDLTPAALAAEQRAREGAATCGHKHDGLDISCSLDLGHLPPHCPDCTGDKCEGCRTPSPTARTCPGCGMATYRDDGVAWCGDCEPRAAKPEGGPAVAREGWRMTSTGPVNAVKP